MQVKMLGELADITLGYTFRGAIVGNKDGNFRVIQARNISSDSFFDSPTSLALVSMDSTRSEAFVKRGEVLITSRGATVGGFKATLFDCDADRPVIASSSLFILHSIKNEKVLPEYLVAYLNSNAVQRELQDRATGATVRSIPRSELGEVEIAIPPIEKQKDIVALQRNIKQQNKLLEERVTLSNQLIDSIINTINT